MESGGGLVVVKIGGTDGVDIGGVCGDIAECARAGMRLVVVHGGSGETNAISEKLGHPPRFVTSPSGFTSRYTDRETLEIFAMVTAGKINTLIVERLQKLGVNAFGVTGLDGRLIVAARKEAIRIIDPETGRQRLLRDDNTGRITSVNGALARSLVDADLTLVIAPLAVSPDGEALNVDADRAAAAVAGALGADQLVILSNVPGLLASFPDESSLIQQIARDRIEEAREIAGGRMKKKVLAAGEALASGVGRVVLGDGRVESPVMRALAGKGTVIS